jgi:hypothetical protein
MKITPVLFVKEVEMSLPFWVGRIGFEKTVEVPGENGIAFAILDYRSVEIYPMLISSILYFQRKITGSLLSCSK